MPLRVERSTESLARAPALFWAGTSFMREIFSEKSSAAV